MNKILRLIFVYVTGWFFLVNILLVPSLAYADEEVTSIKEGDVAPFDGTLFNIEAAARLLIDLEFSKESCKIETDRQLQLQSSQFHLELDVLQASKDSLQYRHDEMMSIRQDRIEYLEKKILRPKVPAEVIFIIGVVAGVGLTIGAGYAMNQAAGG